MVLGFSLAFILRSVAAPIRAITGNMSSLADGKLDGYSVERLTGSYHLRRLALSNKVAVSQDNLVVKNWHIVFNRHFYSQHPQLIEQFWFNLIAARQQLEANYRYPDTTAPH